MTKGYNAESIKVLSDSEATEKFPWKKIEYLADKYNLGQEPIKRGFEASFLLGISPDYYINKYIKKMPLDVNEEFSEVYKELLYKQSKAM